MTSPHFSPGRLNIIWHADFVAVSNDHDIAMAASAALVRIGVDWGTRPEWRSRRVAGDQFIEPSCPAADGEHQCQLAAVRTQQHPWPPIDVRRTVVIIPSPRLCAQTRSVQAEASHQSNH